MIPTKRNCFQIGGPSISPGSPAERPTRRPAISCGAPEIRFRSLCGDGHGGHNDLWRLHRPPRLRGSAGLFRSWKLHRDDYVVPKPARKPSGRPLVRGWQRAAAQDPFQRNFATMPSERVLSLEDSASVERLANLRNPLSHLRNVNNSSNLTRRSMNADQEVSDVLKADAYFAIGIAIKVLSKPPFKIGS